MIVTAAQNRQILHNGAVSIYYTQTISVSVLMVSGVTR